LLLDSGDAARCCAPPAASVEPGQRCRCHVESALAAEIFRLLLRHFRHYLSALLPPDAIYAISISSAFFIAIFIIELHTDALRRFIFLHYFRLRFIAFPLPFISAFIFLRLIFLQPRLCRGMRRCSVVDFSRHRLIATSLPVIAHFRRHFSRF